MPQLRTKKQLEQKRKDDRRQELIKKVGKKMPSPKNLGKIALKATPPGMMLTAAQKLREELIRLTKPKKPGGRAPSTNLIYIKLLWEMRVIFVKYRYFVTLIIP